MKKILLMLLFSLSVIAYASPPPDPVPLIFADNVQCVVQDNQITDVLTLNVPEVAFVDIGNIFQYQCIFVEQVYKVKVPEALVIKFDYNLQGLSRPPSLTEMQGFGNNFRLNMQNTNYGYPFTGDNC